MKRSLLNRQTILITFMLMLGAIGAWLILGTSAPSPAGDEHGQAEDGHKAAAAGPAKGPHGGKLFTEDGYGLEVSIFEQGVEPQFRVFTYRDGTPLAPGDSDITITLERLGRAPEVFKLVANQDYLTSDKVVVEPHSFKAGIAANHADREYRFGYEQIETRVSMSDEQLKGNGVTVMTAGPARIRHLLQLTGEVRLNEDRTVHVVPRLNGIVHAVSANGGDMVSKDQLLAVISSQGLADQRADLLAAQQRESLARETFARESKLWQDGITAEQDYLQARTALRESEIAVQRAQQKLASLDRQATGGELTRYEIRSPIDGVIVEKHVALGEAVDGDTTVFVITDLSTVWAEMDVYPKDLTIVKVGQDATVRATAFESSSQGKVFYVGSLVGEQTRAAKARIVLPNPDGIWRPGLPVTIALTAGEVDVPVAVSRDAIQTVRDWTVVFGRYGSDLEARPVTLGRSDGDVVEVLEGFEAGEQYAAGNSFLIKADLDKAGASHDH